MNIIFGDNIAAEMRLNHTVLQLETFKTPSGEEKTAYCVIPTECLPIIELPDLERKMRLHQALIDGWNRKDYLTVLTGIEHLMGSFQREMDSFYQNLKDRIEGMSSEQ